MFRHTCTCLITVYIAVIGLKHETAAYSELIFVKLQYWTNINENRLKQIIQDNSIIK